MLQPDNAREHKRGDKNLYLLYEAKCAAVLVECGFLSNPAEARRLTSGEYQSQLAFAIYSSITRYMESLAVNTL